MNLLFKRNFALLFLLVFSIQVNALFAAECEVYFATQPVGNYLRKDIQIPEAQIGNTTASKLIAKNVKKFSGEEFSGTTFDEAIDQVYLALKKNETMKPVKKADELAKFGRELHPIFEDMLAKTPPTGSVSAPDLVAWEKRRHTLNTVKTAKYNIARKMSDLENFVKSEFKTVTKEKIVLTQGDNFTNLTHMKMKDYPKYIDSYIHYLNKPNSAKAKLYKNIDEGDLGILDITDIRDITSYNLWPIYAKSHDIRHIHFALTHPMALAAMMNATRSKNNMRYVMIAGIYEGVDRLQYSHESSLTKFFGLDMSSAELFGINRNMDLEEAMLTIATATEKDLKKISELSGANINIGGNDGWLFGGLSTWKPKKNEIVKGNAVDGESFEQEINDMTEQFTKLLNKSEKIKKKLLANPDLVLTKEEQHFMKIMNFQLNPNDPEIVIDGLRYKNDGRAHTGGWGGEDTDATIGIGDN